MIVGMETLSGGGGSSCACGDTVLVNGTESTSVSGVATEFKVNTGLSSISRFYLVGNTQDVSFPVQSVLYDSDVYPSYQFTTLHTNGTPSGSRLPVPSTSASNQAPTIKNISGGEVTLLTSGSSTTYANMTKIHWFAE